MIRTEAWYRSAGPSDELERLKREVERDPNNFETWVTFIRAGERSGRLDKALDLLAKPLAVNFYFYLEDRVRQRSPSELEVELFWKMFTESWDVIERTSGAYPDVPLSVIMRAPESVQVRGAWIEGPSKYRESLNKHVPEVIRRMQEFKVGAEYPSSGAFPTVDFDPTGFLSVGRQDGSQLVIEDRVSDLKKLLAWAERHA